MSQIQLGAYPYPLVTEHFEGTVEQVIEQVRNRLEQIAKESPDGEKLFGFHAIPDVVVSNILND